MFGGGRSLKLRITYRNKVTTKLTGGNEVRRKCRPVQRLLEGITAVSMKSSTYDIESG